MGSRMVCAERGGVGQGLGWLVGSPEVRPCCEISFRLRVVTVLPGNRGLRYLIEN